jgi:hypothetical protein
VVNHLATCICRNGYRGDPFTQCTPIPGETIVWVKITLVHYPN